MTRTRIYITDEQRDGFRVVADGTGLTSSELFRRAVGEHLAREPPSRREEVATTSRSA